MWLQLLLSGSVPAIRTFTAAAAPGVKSRSSENVTSNVRILPAGDEPQSAGALDVNVRDIAAGGDVSTTTPVTAFCRFVVLVPAG